MLAKLMKHELKATARLLIPMDIILLCISMINHFTFQVGIQEGAPGLIVDFLINIQVLFSIAILMVTVIFMITRFYKNLLSDEGYLMFTLPVKVHQLITSKLIITLFWILIGFIVLFLSWGIVVFKPGDMGLIIDAIQRLLLQLQLSFGNSWIFIAVEFIILALLGLVFNILLVYVSIAIGQLFTKHKIIASFISYGILYTIIQWGMLAILSGLSFILYNNTNFSTIATVPQVIFPVAIGAVLIGCIVFYLATNYIFQKKLNLE